MKQITLLSTSLFIALLVGLNFVAYHEMSHGEIFKSYGSTPEYSFDWQGATTTGTCKGNQACISEQNWNDIIGYHLTTVFVFILGMVTLFMLWRSQDD